MLRCQWRRIAGALRAWPLAGALALAAVAASPLVAWRAGRALGTVLQPVLHDPELARLLALAPGVAGATAGAALCLTAAGRRSLGPQLAALPVGARTALVATMVAPAAAALALGLPAALALAVALGAASPGGVAAGIGLVAGALAGAAAGAVAAESILQAGSGARLRGVVSLLLVAAAWVAAGSLQQAPLVGPLAPAGTALSGRGHAVAALAGVLVAAILGGAAWLELAVRRPERVAVARGSRRRRVLGPPAAALPLAATVLLARRRDLRLALLAAVGFGLAGVALAERAGVPAPGPLHLGAGSTLLGAALAPLVVGGVLASGRWAWACAPRARLLPCVALVAAAHAVLVAALAPVLAGTALASGVPPHAVAEVALVAVGLGAAAVLAGALVPWRGTTMGDQVASFAAFAACAGAFSVAAGAAGPRLVAAGAPDAAAAACLLAACTGVSLGAVTRRLRAPGGAA